MRIPHWTGGAFLTIDSPITPPSAPTSPDPTVFVAAGEQNTAVPIRIPGAVWIGTRAAARGSDGTIAVVGEAKDDSGHLWGYLAFFPPNYAPPLIVHTEPYYAGAVAVLPDGTVWTKGIESKNTPSPNGLYAFDKNSTKGILRHYSRTGTLLAAFLPQSDFRPPTRALWGNKISASQDRVGWCQYDGFGAGPQPEGGFYFEITADGSISKTPLPKFAEGERVQTLAITENGYALLQKSWHGTDPHVYALDRAHGTWQSLQFPSTGFQDTSYYLVGVVGNTLAFWAKGPGFTAQFAGVQ